MNVHLTPDLERFVQDKVQAGRYNSASEVVREALRLLEERDDLRALRKEEIRKQIVKGLESLQHSEGVEGEEVFDRIDKELAAIRETSL